MNRKSSVIAMSLLGIVTLHSSARAAGPIDAVVSFCNGLFRSASQVETRAVKYSEKKALKWQRENQCLSCHTVLTYAVGVEVPHRDLLTGVNSRLENWGRNELWYPERAAASLSTELIINLVIKSKSDGTVDPKFLRQLMQYQKADGGWDWLSFDLEPYESKRGRAYGAALVAMVMAKTGNLNKAEFQPMLEGLRKFLRATANSRSAFLWEKLSALWAEVEIKGVLTDENGGVSEENLLDKLFSHQNADGGWSMNDLGNWEKQGASAMAGADVTDGHATAFASFVVARVLKQRNGLGQVYKDRFLKGMKWLVSAQTADGSWDAVSLNRENRFNHSLMEDAATGFAIGAFRESPWPIR